MQRETKEITTTGGNKATLVTYITGAEKRMIAAPYMNAAEGQDRSVRVFASQDQGLTLVIKELNGSSENILERLLELPAPEVDEITEAVEEVLAGKKK